MKIIVIGATGTIGRAVVDGLSGRHEVIKVGNRRGDYQVDLVSQERAGSGLEYEFHKPCRTWRNLGSAPASRARGRRNDSARMKEGFDVVSNE